jgi:hypothetical protein
LLLRDIIEKYNNNSFHPEIANLINERKISLYNAYILAKLTPDLQLAFRREAMQLNSLELEKVVNIDKQILLIAKEELTYWALVPSSKLKNYDLDALNGCCTEDEHIPPESRDDIKILFQRLGITPIEINEDIVDDLKEYLHPTPPFMVDDICSISITHG